MYTDAKIITDCVFNGVVFDKQSVETIGEVAKGLTQVAVGLTELTKVFSAQKIELECMLKMEG